MAVTENESIWLSREDAARRSHFECYYCGLNHPTVEAGGVYGCPNVLCPGPGAYWFRSRLQSFREVENGRHTVDEIERQSAAVEYLVEHPELDELIRQKIQSCIKP